MPILSDTTRLAVDLAVLLVAALAFIYAFRKKPSGDGALKKQGKLHTGLFRQSVENSPNPIFSIDRLGQIQSWNRACQQVFRYGEEILGQDFHQILASTGQGAEIDRLLARAIQDGESISNVEIAYLSQDGEERYTLSRIIPLKDSNSAITGYIFANTDITERKKADQALRRQVEELTLLHRIATASIETESEDELIEQVTGIIGESLYTDNFGILLLDELHGVLRFHASYRGLDESFKGTTIALGQGITGRVAKTGQSCRIEDVSQDPDFIHLSFPAHSELCVPVKTSTRVLGVINAQSSKPNSFTPEDERLLLTLSGQLAIAIERIRAEIAERQRVDELMAITRVSYEITSVLTHQVVLDSIVRHAAELSSSDACGMFAYQPNGRFYLVATYGIGPQMVEAVNQQGLEPAGTAVGRAVNLRRPVQIPDVREDPDYSATYLADMEEIRSILALPMLRGDEVIGGIVLWHRRPRRFTPQEEVFLQALAQQSVNAVENARLFEAESEQRRLAEVLRDTGTVLSASLDFNTVLDRLLDQVSRVVPYEAATVMLVEGSKASILRARGYEQFSPNIPASLINLSFDIESTPNLAQMVKSQRPLIIADIQNDPDWVPEGATAYLHSYLGVPILIGGEVIAFFSLETSTINYYQPFHGERLAVFAGQAALALQNSRLFEETQRRASYLEALNAIIVQAAAAANMDGLLDTTLDHAMLALGVDMGGMRLGERIITRNLSPECVSAFALLAEEIGSQNTPVCFEDWEEEQISGRYTEIAGLFIQSSVRASITVPILAEGNVIGRICLACTKPRDWLKDDKALVDAVGRQLGATVERLQLLEQTQRRLREVTLLSKVITVTASAVDIGSALGPVCEEVARFFGAEQSGFALVDATNTSAMLIAEYSEVDRPSALGLQLPVDGNPSMAYILEHKVPLAISNIHASPLMAEVVDILSARNVVSILITPILINGKVVGTLGIDSFVQRDYTQSDLDLLENISRQIGQALERLQLFNNARQHAQHMALLADLSGSLNQPLTLEEVVAGIGMGAQTLTECDRIAIFVRNSAGEVVCPWSKNLSSDYLSNMLGRLEDVPGARLLAVPEPILLADILALPEDNYLRKIATQEDYRSLALWPLVYENQTDACIACYYNDPHPWVPEQQEVLLAFTRQASVALQNARLFDETRRRSIQQEALNAIIAAAVIAPDLADLLGAALELTLKALGVEKGGIWASGRSVLQNLPPEVGLSGELAAHSQGLDINSTQVVGDWLQVTAGNPIYSYQGHMEQFGIRASIAVPVLAGGRRIGGMSIASSQPRHWMAEEIALVETIGRQLGNAVDRLNLLAKTQEQARQVQQIMDTVPDGVLLLDPDQHIVLANPAAWQYLVHLVEVPRLDQPLNRLANLPISELLRRDPERQWYEVESFGTNKHTFEVAARPLETQRKKEGWVLVLRDVTEERENQKRIQMQERLATVGQLAAGIAHDFNNIMAAIVVYADLLSMEPHMSQSSRERLAIIQQQVQRATSLIRQILDFSRRSVMEQSSLDLLPFIKELDKLLGRVLPENIRLELSYQPGTYMVNADPTRLQQVFMNLSLNGRDAMPEGGILHFELERMELAPEDAPPLPELTPGSWIRIWVTDTGVGVPADLLPHIFDPFFTTKPVGKGTGLGLAQVYGIIKQHGGSIDVQSRMGKGTSFIIYLPALPVEQKPAAGEEPIPEIKGRGRTVLVVEDEPVARRALRALLENLNYRVLEAENGLQALQVWESARSTISMVVSDVVMPEMGGVELYYRLCEQSPQVKMLFVTGHPMDEESQSLLERREVHWLQKPYSLREFAKVVREILAE